MRKLLPLALALFATPALAQSYPSPTYNAVTAATVNLGALNFMQNGTTAPLLLALPSSAVPWQLPTDSTIYFGRSIPGTDGTNYLGEPYAPMTPGLAFNNSTLEMFGTTYGWSGNWHNDQLLTVSAGDPFTTNIVLPGTRGMQLYSDRLSYGQADSHTVEISNTGRGVMLTLTGLTATNFTTDPGVIDPNTGAPIYRISFAAANVAGGLNTTAGQLPPSATMTGLHAGDTVFTSNGFMAFIVKADPNGTWVDVDNWTRGASNIAGCPTAGPSVQPTSTQACTADIETGGATSLTAYVGTETTFEPLYLVNWLPSDAVNPIGKGGGGIEFNTSDNKTAPIVFDINVPGADSTFLAEIYAAPSNQWGNGTFYSGGLYRAFVVDTRQLTTANGTVVGQPLCGLCITYGSTVQNAIMDDRSVTTGNVLYSDTGSGTPATAVITKPGDAVFTDLGVSGNLSAIPSPSLGSGGILRSLVGWNFSGSDEEMSFINNIFGAPQSFGWFQRNNASGNTVASFSEYMNLDSSGNLSVFGNIEGAALQLASKTVAGLGSCTSTNVGAVKYVSDATSPTYNGTLTGGGTVGVLALCESSGGTYAWTAH